MRVRYSSVSHSFPTNITRICFLYLSIVSSLNSGQGFRSVYLTPTISLALQQSAYLRHHTPLKVGIFHGKKGVSQWDADR